MLFVVFIGLCNHSMGKDATLNGNMQNWFAEMADADDGRVGETVEQTTERDTETDISF